MTVQGYQKKTILKVVPALNSGGVERGTIELAKKIVELGNNSMVISSGGKMVRQLDECGCKHVKINVASKNPFIMIRNIFKIADVIKKYKVDILHVHSRAPAWSCYWAAKISGAKLVTTFHGVYNFNNFIKKFYNSIMVKGRLVIAVSNFIKQHIIDNYGADQDKIRVIHRGINHQEFMQSNVPDEVVHAYRDKYNAPDNVPILLMPSRMTRWKGHLVLIEALNKIKNLDFYCLLVGDMSKHPEYVDEVKNLICKYKLQSKVQLFADESNIVNLYGISDIVISTSIEPEAFGRTIIEAQSMEKLVVASNIGGACETIEDTKTGFHAESGSPEGFAEKISHCLEILHSKEHKKIVTAARKNVVKKFSLDLMLPQVLKVYEEL